MMKCKRHNLPVWLLVLTFHHFFIPSADAQSCGFSTGKSLHELQLAVYERPAPADSGTRLGNHPRAFNGFFFPLKASLSPTQSVFLPRWSAEDLPFFCKIEHNWAKNRARIPVKFRLGSVEYVDWLEGKN
jgi:hypothetical protein